MIDNLVEIGRDADRVEAELARHWLERGFITDEEALGNSNGDGAVLAVANPTTLKMAREAHLIRSVSMRKKPRGWIRTWPVEEIVRAEVVSQLGNAWGISVKSASVLLQRSSQSDSVVGDDGETGDGRTHIDTTGAASSTTVPDWLRKPISRYANELMRTVTAKEAAPQFGSCDLSNTVITLIDRRWMFIRGVTQPDGLAVGTDKLVAEVDALKSLNTKVHRFLDYAGAESRPGRQAKVNRANESYERPQSVMSFDVTETLRRFALHLNSMEDTPME